MKNSEDDTTFDFLEEKFSFTSVFDAARLIDTMSEEVFIEPHF